MIFEWLRPDERLRQRLKIVIAINRQANKPELDIVNILI